MREVGARSPNGWSVARDRCESTEHDGLAGHVIDEIRRNSCRGSSIQCRSSMQQDLWADGGCLERESPQGLERPRFPHRASTREGSSPGGRESSAQQNGSVQAGRRAIASRPRRSSWITLSSSVGLLDPRSVLDEVDDREVGHVARRRRCSVLRPRCALVARSLAARRAAASCRCRRRPTKTTDHVPPSPATLPKTCRS